MLLPLAVRAAPAASALLFLVLSCTTGRDGEPAPFVPYPAASFAVLSDIHVYDRSLGSTGAAFERYLEGDRKLLVQSEEILRQALLDIAGTDSSFLVVSGDLTKDGEESSHLLAASLLAGAERAGIEVFVVPGNHDIRNPHAKRFLGDRSEPVKYVEPEEFAAIYEELGYGEALDRDPQSLSYVAEPVSGLWLLCIDSTASDRNVSQGSPETGGRLSAARRAWLERVLERAAQEGKAVVAVLHHGLVPHTASQGRYFREYLLDGYPEIGHLLARSGVRVAFTGHFHAQDVSIRRFGGSSSFGEPGMPRPFLADVETGSLVTWPCAYRLARIEQGVLRLDTRRVTSLPSFQERGEDFPAFALASTREGVAGISVSILVRNGVRPLEAEMLSGQIADAFLAHYAGDERFAGTEMLTTSGLSLVGRLVVGLRKNLVSDLWKDSEGADNNLRLSLDTGDWAREE